MWEWLLRRVCRRGALPALPAFVVGTLFALRLFSPDEMERALMFEIQLVLVFPLIVGPVLARPRTWLGHTLRVAWLLGIFFLFVAPAPRRLGWGGVLALLALTYATLSGPLHERGDHRCRSNRMMWRVSALPGSSAAASSPACSWDGATRRRAWPGGAPSVCSAWLATSCCAGTT